MTGIERWRESEKGVIMSLERANTLMLDVKHWGRRLKTGPSSPPGDRAISMHTGWCPEPSGHPGLEWAYRCTEFLNWKGHENTAKLVTSSR